ncbi:PucR family transcriptional regulator [Mycolicibacterium sp. CH28]|nr:PucR family transcriptional regulator [Mycolicibacterium sp. CH28]
MAMSVRRLAHIPTLGLKLVAGRDNADRPIAWAHAIELEDPTPYLSGGELVMTTGMNVGTTADQQFDYLARLSAAGVAALAFDTGTTHAAVPAGIIAAGDALGLPVLSVPPETPFIAITRAIIDEVTADQLHSVQRVVDQQEVLVRETLRNGIPAVVAALSRLLSATVVVIDVDGNTLAANGSEIQHIRALCATLVTGNNASRKPRHAGRVVADGSGFCTIQALKAAQSLHGYLAVKTDGPPSPPERLLVSHAVSLISIEMSKPAKILDAEHRLRSAATKGLLADPPTVDDAVLRYFRIDPDAEVVVLVMTDTGPSLAAETHAHRVLGSYNCPYLISSSADELIVILHAGDSASAPDLVVAISAQLQRHLRAGISKPTMIADITTAVSQARAAARMGNAGGPLHDFADLGLFDLILGTRSAEELSLVAQPIATLVDHDRDPSASNDSLLATLDSYLRHNGQLEGAAAELSIHRHTLRNRIVKISQLTGQDLHSADARAQLLLAIRAREMLLIQHPQT